jgi:hypothetical protein
MAVQAVCVLGGVCGGKGEVGGWVGVWGGEGMPRALPHVANAQHAITAGVDKALQNVVHSTARASAHTQRSDFTRASELCVCTHTYTHTLCAAVHASAAEGWALGVGWWAVGGRVPVCVRGYEHGLA